MRTESPQLVKELARQQGESLVSCYVPLARTGNDVRQNGIRVKNCQRALATAHAAGTVDARTLATASNELARVARFTEDPRAARPFGVALFASPEDCVTVQASAPLASSVTIAPRYYVVPLVPLTAAPPSIFVLALSRHAVRLIEPATQREVPLPAEVPRSLTDVVGSEKQAASLRRHAVGNGSIFHGHGEGNDDVLPEIELYCRRIAASLAARIGDAGTAVVLAGDVQITAVFRRAAVGWPLLDEQIHGNHDRTPAAQLAAFAAPLVAARQNAARAQWKTLYGVRSAEHRASDDPRAIAAAAHDGRIDTLLLEHGAALDEPGQRAAREPLAIQPEGPFNGVTVLTLRSGGEVHVVPAADMPTPAPQAAIFRF